MAGRPGVKVAQQPSVYKLQRGYGVAANSGGGGINKLALLEIAVSDPKNAQFSTSGTTGPKVTKPKIPPLYTIAHFRYQSRG